MNAKKAWGGWKPRNKLGSRPWIAVCAVVFALAASLAASPQSQTWERPGRITQAIDSTQLVRLPGGVRADLAAAPDLGPVEDELPLRLSLVLQRSPEQQAELDNLLARQQQPTAPEYHQWLTAQEFGARFGASPDDIGKITGWLESQGMRVNGVMNNALLIDFSATAGQVREVFGTQLHYYDIRGGRHAATPADPMIPAALAPVVSGIKGLNKIPPMALHTRPGHASYDAAAHRWQRAEAGGGGAAVPSYFDTSKGAYFVGPQDYYTIYNVGKVFAPSPNGDGNLGASATVAVIEDSDFEYGSVNSSTGVAGGGDVNTFRGMFGVPGTLNMHVYHGYGSVTCSDPGIDPAKNGEEMEAALDAEWINALAPSANLIFMSCDDVTDDGVFTSMAALIDNNLADAMSLSYGDSEIGFTSAEYTAQDTLYAQAAAQGQTIVISAGDGGSDLNDFVNGTSTAVSGYNVNAFASSPNVTAAGGTDFSDLYDDLQGGLPQSDYWSAGNNPYYGDALSYIPETAWNDNCSGSLLASYFTYSGATLCGTAVLPFGIGDNPYITYDIVGGSGGFSTHYAAPAYQKGITGYAGNMRAQPDISGFASDGYVWNHALIFCDSYGPGAPGYPAAGDPDAANAPCSSTSNFGLAGGTSFVAPSLAGVAGLLVTSTGSRQGLLNPALYALAKAQFTAPATGSACYANGQTANTGRTTGLPNSAACIFNDVTTGNNDVPCAPGSTRCYVNSGAAYGMLSLSGALAAAYASTVGYDEATGIGTLNVYNLIAKWNTAFTSTTALTANPTTIAANQSTTFTATVTGGAPTGSTHTPAVNGSVNFVAGTTALGSCTLSGGGCTLPVNGSALQSGANSIAATFAGSGNYPSSTSRIVTVTVETGLQTQAITFSSPGTQVYGVGSIALAASGGGSGNPVTYTVLSGPGTVSGGTLTITGAGSIVVQASQAGNGSYAAAAPVNVTVTVNPAVLTVTANNASMVYGQALPSFSYTISGYGNGDPSTVVSGTATLTTTATSASTAGTYPITFASESLSASNYTFSYVSGTLTISGLKAQTITFAQPATQTYGAGSIALSASASSGLAVSYAVLSGPGTVSGGTLTITGAGSIVVQASQAGNGSYAAAAPVNVTVTVNPAVLTVTANNASMVSGQALPSFSYTISGYGNGDPSTVVSGAATLTTTATSASTAGTYPITFASESLSASNYTFSYVSGTLTISIAAPVNYNVTASPTTLSIPLGQSGTTTITLTGSNGYDGTVSFYCGSLPTGMSCSFAPSSLTAPTNGSAVTTVLTVTTSAASAGLHRSSSRPGVAAYWTMGFGILGFVLAGGGARRKRLWMLGLLVLSLAFAFTMTACGGGGSSGGVTPVVSSTITVSAVASANGVQAATSTQTLSLTILVTQ